MSDVKIVKRNINSKILFEEINETIFEAITSLGVRWSNEANRSAFVEVLEDYLEDKVEEQKIEQYKVVCDKRNNKSFSDRKKHYLLEVFYKQPHCLNTSRIEYHISK